MSVQPMAIKVRLSCSGFILNNYPKLDDILFQSRPFVDRNESVCFTGYIDDLRGEKIMVEAMKESNATLIIAGDKVKATNAK